MIICVCTAGKDRSPAMARVIKEAFPELNTSAMGISERRTSFHRTKYAATCYWAVTSLVICATAQHYYWIQGFLSTREKHGMLWPGNDPLVINFNLREFYGDLTKHDKKRLIKLVTRHYDRAMEIIRFCEESERKRKAESSKRTNATVP